VTSSRSAPRPYPRPQGSPRSAPLRWATLRRSSTGTSRSRRKAHIGPGTEVQNLILCALTAVCYDSQVRGLGLDLTELWMPEDEFAIADGEPDGARLVRQEGWIYFRGATPSSGR
jgi:hypothetical protein